MAPDRPDISRMGSRSRQLERVTGNIRLHSTKLRCSEIQLLAKTALARAARSAAALFEHLSSNRAHLSGREKAAGGWPNRTTRQHFHVGDASVREWLQPNSCRRCRSRI